MESDSPFARRLQCSPWRIGLGDEVAMELGWMALLFTLGHPCSFLYSTVLYRVATARPFDVVSTIKLSAITSVCFLALSDLRPDCQLRPEDTPSYFGRQLAWFQGLGIQVVSTLYVSTLFSLLIRGGHRIQTLGEKRF